MESKEKLFSVQQNYEIPPFTPAVAQTPRNLGCDVDWTGMRVDLNTHQPPSELKLCRINAADGSHNKCRPNLAKFSTSQ